MRAAVRRSAESAADIRVRLRRRETPEALARAELHKIQLLSIAYRAYRAHFRGAKAALLRHLHDAGGAGNAGLPVDELERLDMLRKDYLAWLTYQRTGELPQRVFSENINVSPGYDEAYGWLSELTPERREQVEAATSAAQEYGRLRLSDKQKLEEWLAKAERQDVRRAMYDIMRKAASVQMLAMRDVRRARAKKAPKPQTAAAATAAPAKPPTKKKESPQSLSSASPNESKPQAKAPAKRRSDRGWMNYLEPHEREEVEARRASFNEYSRFQKYPEELKAWLAADDEQGTRRALYKRLYDDYIAFRKILYKGLRRRKASEAEAGDKPMEDEDRGSAKGKTGVGVKHGTIT
jgi:hypothetical protein